MADKNYKMAVTLALNCEEKGACTTVSHVLRCSELKGEHSCELKVSIIKLPKLDFEFWRNGPDVFDQFGSEEFVGTVFHTTDSFPPIVH